MTPSTVKTTEKNHKKKKHKRRRQLDKQAKYKNNE